MKKKLKLNFCASDYERFFRGRMQRKAVRMGVKLMGVGVEDLMHVMRVDRLRMGESRSLRLE
jgi:hypothetical protein